MLMPATDRPMNFNAGPAALPRAVLERCREELLDFDGSGLSVMEHSHRGASYERAHRRTTARLRSLINIPDGGGAQGYDVLYVQGGASHQFAMVPLNLLPAGSTAGYVVTGSWGERAVAEAKALAATGGGEARVVANTVPSKGDNALRRLPWPGEARSSVGDTYVHLTTNETIDGVQFATAPGASMPDFGPAPVVADMSSDIAWRRVDVRQFGLAYAGAQKNLGPSGVTVVIIRRDLVEAGRADIPTILQYRTFAKHDSLYNTPPTFAIYLMGLVLEWIEGLGGLDVIEARNRAKAAAIYDAIDASPAFYRCPVEVGSRSLMNVTFRLPTPEAETRFLAEASAQGMTGLAGHRSVGGIRASLYNAVEPAWAQALASLMRDHAMRHG